MKNITVIAIHALGGYSARFDALVDFYREKEIEVEAFDLIGFGFTTKSGRGDIESINEHIFEIHSLLIELRKGMPENKVVLLGEDYGGLIALLYAITFPYDIEGLMVVNPLVDANLNYSFWERFLLFWASYFVPRAYFRIPYTVVETTNDNQLADAIMQDPMECNKITARFWMSMVKATYSVQSAVSKIKIPVLFQISSYDRIVSPQKVKAVYRRIASTKKRLFEYPLPHHLCLCKERQMIFLKQIQFIEKLILA